VIGLLAVLGGHVLGIAIPASWTAALGVPEHAYQLLSVSLGTLSGLATVAGLGILLYRRSTVPAVRNATTTIDKVMYLLLSAAIGTRMLNTAGSNLIGGGYDYRATVSPWFRSLFTIHPQPELMAGVPISFQIHNLVALTLLAIWPYTRLVHVFSAPLGYLTRPYVVYRSRDANLPGARRYAPRLGGTRPTHRTPLTCARQRSWTTTRAEQFDSLALWGHGESPAVGAGSVLVDPPGVGGFDLIPEHARSVLVHGIWGTVVMVVIQPCP
jgi:nitrate reductase gamma subunit